MRWAAVLLALAAPVAADEAAIEAAWRDWVADTGVTQSTLAISKDGVVLGSYGIGRAADDPMPLASLSKAITGACVLTLIDEGAFGLGTSLGVVFQDRPDLLGQGADITIESLLTQTSGLHVDRTQSLLNPTLWGAGDMHDQITTLALERDLGPLEFFYNNENYAVLGSAIMEITGETVQDACSPRVLAGLESAAPNGRTGGSLAWGGWEMSVADYARFAATLDLSDDWPKAWLGGASYGPGVFVRDTAQGTNIWHFGGFCLLGLGDHGSYFYVLDNGWGVAVAYNKCLSGPEARALDNTLAAAAYVAD